MKNIDWIEQQIGVIECFPVDEHTPLDEGSSPPYPISPQPLQIRGSREFNGESCRPSCFLVESSEIAEKPALSRKCRHQEKSRKQLVFDF